MTPQRRKDDEEHVFTLSELSDLFIGWKVAAVGFAGIIVTIGVVVLGYSKDQSVQNTEIAKLDNRLQKIELTTAKVDTILYILRTK